MFIQNKGDYKMSANKSSTEDGYKTVATCLGVLIALPLVMVYGYFVNGFVLSKLWSWFVVTTFGMEPLTIVQALGVSIVIGFLTSKPVQDDDKNKTTTEKIAKYIGIMLAPWVTLFAGWIVYSTWFIK